MKPKRKKVWGFVDAEQPDEWLPRYGPRFFATKKMAVVFCEEGDVEIELGEPIVEIRPCYLPNPLPKKRKG